MGLRIAIDTGGTFTDVVAIDEATGAITAVKTPSTPADPSIGLLDGVKKALAALDRPRAGPHHAPPRLDGRDQRRARAQIRRARPPRHARFPRHDRDRAAVGAGRLRQLVLLGEAAAAGAAPPRPRGAGTAPLRRLGSRAARRGSDASRRRRAGRGRGALHRRLPPPLLRQWRARAGRRRADPRALPGRLRVALLGGAAGIPRI